MANFIQSRVYLIHKVQPAKPTEPSKPTVPDGNKKETLPSPPDNNTKESTANENQDEGGVLKLLGSASVQRRLLNLGLGITTQAVTYVMQDMEFKQSFIGNSRGAEKIQQQKAAIVSGIQFTNRTLSTAITAAALNNVAIYGVYAMSVISDVLGRLATQTQMINEYNANRTKELYENKYMRDRLIRDVYNRR